MKLWLNVEYANHIELVDLVILNRLDFDIYIFDFDDYGQFVSLGELNTYLRKLHHPDLED